MHRYSDTFDVISARRMLVALTAYRRAFEVFVRSGMNTTSYDELASCMEEIRLAKSDLFERLSREVVDLVLIHSEVMTHLWQQQLSEIRGVPASLALAMDADTIRLCQAHEEAVSRLDAACRAITASNDPAGQVAARPAAPAQPPRYAHGR